MQRSMYMRRLGQMVVLLNLVVVSRFIWLNQMAFDIDETRTAMRAMGSLSQTLAWQPLDWPPLYNLLINLWQRMVSPHPITLRISSTLLFIPAIPLAYQAAQRIAGSDRAAWGTAIIYSALGYSVFLSLYLRAYALALLLLPILLILTHDYFEHREQQGGQWLHKIALGVVIALLFYTTYTALLAFGIIGLYTLLRYRRAIWKWWLPVALSIVLVLPELVRKAAFLQNRVGDAAPTQSFLVPVLEFIRILFFEIFGQGAWIWLIVSTVAISLLLWHRRDELSAWLLLSVIAIPLLLYLMIYVQLYRIISVRYVWWGLLLVALLLGTGLARLPIWLWRSTMLLILIMMFFPTTLDERYPAKTDPIEENLIWLSENIHSGDIIYFDPHQSVCWQGCFHYDRWVYYGDVLLDQRLQIVNDPADAQRVWYIHTDGFETSAAEQMVSTGRLPSIFYGPPEMLMYLYEAPPNPEGILFGDTLRFHGIQWLDEGQPQDSNLALIEQTDITVRLWWSVDSPPMRPLSVSLQLIGDEGLILQDDQTPVATSLNPAILLDLPPDMTTWQEGQYYVETRTLSIPSFDRKFDAEVALVVYQWWDNVRLTAPLSLEDGRLTLDEVLIIGW